MTVVLSPPRTGRPPTGRSRATSRRRRWVTVVVAVLLVALLATAGWLVWFSSVLAATGVAVSGNAVVSADRVKAAAQVPLGRPLARQDLSAIARRAAQIPQVERVNVRRDWPHTVAISVVERKPLLALAQGSGFLIVDRLGIAYETRGARPAGTLLVQVDPRNTALLVEVGAVARALPPSLADQVVSVTATTRDDIRLVLTSRIVVTWGDATDSQLKAQVAAALVKRHPKVSVDVSSPHQPALR